eukprot:12144282-Alexandrium_andersonii.AAC.1
MPMAPEDPSEADDATGQRAACQAKQKPRPHQRPAAATVEAHRLHQQAGRCSTWLACRAECN